MPADHRSPGPARDGRLGQPPVGVVVGVDGSPAATAAVRWAADWAHERSIPLRMATAHQVAAHSAIAHARVRTELHTLLIRSAAVAVARHPDLSVAMDIVRQSPTAALVDLGSRAELVVVGKRGAGGWSGLLLGSVAADVAAHADCVVVVVPRDFEAVRGRPVVLGIDGGPESREAAEFAFRTAQASGRPLTAVYVAPERQTLLGEAPGPPPSPPAGSVGPDLGELPEAVEAALEDAARRHPAVTVVRRHAVGNPAVQLCRLAVGAALLVVGSRGRGGFAGLLLGSTSRDSLQAASCPVAVVRPGDLATLGGTTRQGSRPSQGWGMVSPRVGA